MSRSLLLALGLLSAAAAVAQPVRFSESGAMFDLPSAVGVQYGAAVADVNRDGVLDLFLPNRLYLGSDPLSYRDIYQQDPRFDSEMGKVVFGGILADVDGDGFPELFVEDFEPGSRLFKNRFGVRFEVASGAGVDMSQAQSQGALWGDFDGDGNLDLFVGEELGKNRLFFGDGVGGFRDSGDTSLWNDQKSYGVAAYDYDQDGDLDIFIAACHAGSSAASVNVLFRNNGDGTFTDVAEEAGVDDDLAGWGVAWLDYDRDGWQDVYVVNMPTGDGRAGFNLLYRNLGDGTFKEVGEAAGVRGDEFEAGFGLSAGDFDNDGWVDLYVGNDFSTDRLYRNNGDGTFTDVLPTLPDGASQGIAVAVGDLDGSGGLDIYKGGGIRHDQSLWLNDGPAAASLRLRLRSSSPGNRQGVGAEVALWQGGEVRRAQLTVGDGMTSQNDGLIVHLGMAGMPSPDSLVVVWADGDRQVVERPETMPSGLSANMHLVQGVGLNTPPGRPGGLAPQAGERVPSGDYDLRFEWEVVEDPDGDPVTYTLALLGSGEGQPGPGRALTFSGLTGTSIAVSMGDLPADRYHWVVVAEDGYWVRSSGSERELIVGSPTALEPAPDAAPIWSVYPNPSHGAARLRFGQPAPAAGVVRVIDLLGRIVLEQTVGQGDPGSDLPLETLAAGTYVAQWAGTARIVVRLP